jgi:hypothetical protein
MTDDYESRRNKDDKDEKLVGEWLDKYFYPTWTSTSTRNFDKELQIRGLDISVTSYEGIKYTIDEKAATHWIGKSLQTFAQELNSVNTKGELYTGWLFQTNSASEYLMEIWVDGVDSIDNKLHEGTDITDITITLVNKKDLLRYIAKRGGTASQLISFANDIRNYGFRHHTGGSCDYDYWRDLKVVVQKEYQERAANILIPRSVLVNEIATKSWRIKNHKITLLRKK